MDGAVGEVVDYFRLVQEGKSNVSVVAVVGADGGEVEGRPVVEVDVVDTCETRELISVIGIA
jgi:hypothetical protein